MTPRILLLGGHGKVSLLMTPKLLARSWNLTSVIRDPEQKADVLEAGKHGPGKLDVLIASIEHVKSDADAKKILDQVKPDWVVWSAGAGGKGGPERTYAIDRDACLHFIRSAIATPSISKFLLLSAVFIRRGRASWFDDESYAAMQRIDTENMPHYYHAKLAADEALTVLGEERMKREQGGKGKFSYIILRPGMLTDEKETGMVSLGRTSAKGSVPRGDVADVAARFLEMDGASGWYDMMSGTEPAGDAVKRVVKEGIHSMAGEDIEVMKRNMA